MRRRKARKEFTPTIRAAARRRRSAAQCDHPVEVMLGKHAPAGIEQRVAKMARAIAKLVIAERRSGNVEGAKRLEQAAIEAAELMRAGKL